MGALIKGSRMFPHKKIVGSKNRKEYEGDSKIMVENLLQYLSYQIRCVCEELNKGTPLSRKLNRWRKKATVLKHQVTESLNDDVKNSPLKSEKLESMAKNMREICECCPVHVITANLQSLIPSILSSNCEIQGQPINVHLDSGDAVQHLDKPLVSAGAELEAGNQPVSLVHESEAVPVPVLPFRCYSDISVGSKEAVEIVKGEYSQAEDIAEDQEISEYAIKEVSSLEIAEEDTVSLQHMEPNLPKLPMREGDEIVEVESCRVHYSADHQSSTNCGSPNLPKLPMPEGDEIEIVEIVEVESSQVHYSGDHKSSAEYDSLILPKLAIPEGDETVELDSSQVHYNGDHESSTQYDLSNALLLKQSSESPQCSTPNTFSLQIAEEPGQQPKDVYMPSPPEHEVGAVTVTISRVGYVDLKLQTLRNSSQGRIINFDEAFGMDPKRDDYLFYGVMKPGLDYKRHEPSSSEPPETSKSSVVSDLDYVIINRAGSNSKEMLSDNEWQSADVVNLAENDLLSLPEKPYCPRLSLLLLQGNKTITSIPQSFFDDMPALRFVDLSITRIRKLPHSLYQRTELQVLMLRNCVCLDGIQTEVEGLKSLEVLDLSGTELFELPETIGELTGLRHLQLSFYGPDDESEYAHLPSELVSTNIISKLDALQELRIDVHPEDHRWTKIARKIIVDVGKLKMLNYLQYYFPTVESLQYFVQVSPSWNEQRLTRFKFIAGQNVNRILSRVPHEVESKYNEHNQCLRFVNGEGAPQAIQTVLKIATAFYLDHTSRIKSLTEFGISNFNELKFCVVRECPNIEDLTSYDQPNESAFSKLEHLGVYYLWELQCIWNWKDPVPQGNFQMLKSLTVQTCPKLSFVVSQSIVECLSNLEELVVQDCESVRVIIEEKSTKTVSPVLPGLKKLVLRFLPQLVTIGDYICLSERVINIRCCPKLNLNPQLKRLPKPSTSCNCNSLWDCCNFCLIHDNKID